MNSTQILDKLPDSIRIIGKDRKVIWANKLFEGLVGKEKKELNGNKCHEYLCISRSLGEKDCQCACECDRIPRSLIRLVIRERYHSL